MVDWIHCNACYRQPGCGRRFQLTNCGHMLCDDCLSSGCDLCKICNEKCKLTPLTSEMSPEASMYFTDPNELAHKMLKQYNDFIQVIDFQRSHRRKLATYNYERAQALNTKLSAATAAVLKMQKMDLEVQKLQKEQENSRTEISYLKQELEKSRKETGYLRKLLELREEGKSVPHSLTRAHGDLPLKDPADDLSQGSALKKSNQRSSDSEERFSDSQGCQQSSSQGMPVFSFRTPSVTHISPALTRLSVRTPPSNGKLGEIPHYPPRNLSLYTPTPTMPSVRESPRPMETNEDRSIQSSSRSMTNCLLARFQVNFPNLKP